MSSSAGLLRNPASSASMCRMVCKQREKLVVSSYKESRNNKPMYGYIILPNLSPSPNLY